MSSSNLLEYQDTDEKLPGLRTFSALVGLMVATLIIFIVLFLTCLVVMVTANGQFGRSSGHRGRFQSSALTGMDRVRAAIAPDRLLVDSGKREKACIFILARNEDLRALLDTLREFEDRFNKRFNYPYVFLNDKPFTPDFEYSVRNIIRTSQVTFDTIPAGDWQVPSHIDTDKNRESRRRLAHIIHGASQSYRKMCRWYSGKFMHHPAIQEYEWFWRIEPGVHFPCDIASDPFVRLRKENKVIGFSILMSEIEETISGLFESVLEFKTRENIHTDSKLWNYFTFQGLNGTAYNGCHIWNNFEIARFDFFRSPQYQRYFDHLDSKGGFFYERWGDAPVISLAAALLLRHDQLLHFEDIGYKHDDSSFCPGDALERSKLLCSCDPYEGGDTTTNGCMTLWRRMQSIGETDDEAGL